VFAEHTFAEIYRYTGGVPRLVNTLCDTAMMAAFTTNRDVVTVGDVASAIDELQWVEFTVRQQQQAARAAADGHATSTNPSATATAVLGVSPPTPVADAAAQPVGRLLVATDGRTVQEIPLKVGRVIVGRTTDNDVQIDSRFVSRHHCQVITTPQACVIEDLNSTNGIYVKSKRVRRHYLNDGDVVLIGKHELIYIDERLPRSRAPFIETLPGMPPPAEPVGEPN
jgi:ATP-dependent 26S proteasome regulatory subunit